MWGGVYGTGMHDFICHEAELGFRVAVWISEADCDPMGWYYDLLYRLECEQTEACGRCGRSVVQLSDLLSRREECSLSGSMWCEARRLAQSSK